MRESASRRPSGSLAIPALTASLGSVTDTLNCNWDCAYANDFPSQLKTTWANGGPVAQEEIGIMGGDVTLAGRFSGIRTQNGHVKVKGRLSRGNSAGRAPSLRGIPWNLPYNLGKSTEKPLSGQSKNVN